MSGNDPRSIIGDYQKMIAGEELDTTPENAPAPVRVVNAPEQNTVQHLISSIRSQIFSVPDRAMEDVYVDRWGITLRVVEMSSQESTDMLQSAIDQKTRQIKFSRMYSEIVIATVHAILPNGELGPKLFTAGDRDVILARSASIVEHLAQVAMRLSGMTSNGLPDIDAGKGE